MERNGAVEIDEVYFGDANQAGEDNRNVARMAVLLAGLPTSIPGATVNRLCGSGMEAVFSASRAIASGDESICLAGGVESMSRAPWVVLKPEKPFPRTHETMHSTTLGWRMVNPEMPDEWTVSLGEGAEILADRYGITREQQDAFALRSHQRGRGGVGARGVRGRGRRRCRASSSSATRTSAPTRASRSSRSSSRCSARTAR